MIQFCSFLARKSKHLKSNTILNFHAKNQPFNFGLVSAKIQIHKWQITELWKLWIFAPKFIHRIVRLNFGYFFCFFVFCLKNIKEYEFSRQNSTLESSATTVSTFLAQKFKLYFKTKEKWDIFVDFETLCSTKRKGDSFTLIDASWLWCRLRRSSFGHGHVDLGLFDVLLGVLTGLWAFVWTRANGSWKSKIVWKKATTRLFMEQLFLFSAKVYGGKVFP